MEIYKTETDINKPYNDKWTYKLYLFKEQDKNLGSVILFRDVTSSKPYGITIIRSLASKMGSKMIEVVLNDTPEGILPSEDKFISESAKNMWLRNYKNPIFKHKFLNFENRVNHNKEHLDKVYFIDLKRYYKFKDMSDKEIKECIKICSDTLLEEGYKGTSKFLRRDLIKMLIPEQKKSLKIKM